MKRSLILFVSAGLLLSACSSESPVENGNGQLAPSTEPSGYLTVNLLYPGGMTTRDDASGSNGGNYLNGNAAEGKVSLVRLYFFDEAGNPVLVRQNPYDEGEYFSYYDWDPNVVPTVTGSASADGQHIESTMSTTLMLNSPTGETTPTRLMAVVNPPASLTALGNPTQNTLRNRVADYAATGEGKFIMSNFVFVATNETTGYTQGVTVDYTVIGENNIANNADDAKANSIVIYVERVLAKVTFDVDTEKMTPVTTIGNLPNVYAINVNYKPVDDESVAEQPVYVQFLGWAITSAPDASYLFKNINAQWNANLFGNTEPWNAAAYHRSFWALNPAVGSFAYTWKSFNDLTGEGGATQTGLPMTVNYTYTTENANPAENVGNADLTLGANPTLPSKLIVAGRLIDANGQPLTIVEYGKEYYTLEGLTTLAANSLNMYYDNNGVITKIKPDQLQIVTYSQWLEAQGLGAATPDDSGTYNVYFLLTDEAAKQKWYHDATGSATEITDPTTFIKDSIQYARIWNNGDTYYYFTIKHLGSNTGLYGVVRNHIYATTVSSLLGLGTPVYDPSEVIYPEKPDDEGNVISAQVNVLQWREVSQDYDFAW